MFIMWYIQNKAVAKNKQPSFPKVILRAFWPHLALAGVFKLFGDLLAFVGPWCIESIVNYAYRAAAERDRNKTAPTGQTTNIYTPTNTSNLTLVIAEDPVSSMQLY